MAPLLQTLHGLDIYLVSKAAAWSAQVQWRSTLVYLAAQIAILVMVAILISLWGASYHRNKGAHYGGKKAVMLALVCLVAAVSIKTVIAVFITRDRPFMEDPTILHMAFQVDAGSFPSGHALVAFTIAFSVLASGYRKVGSILLGLAILVGLGRVFAGVHYPSDVLAGIVFAAIVVALLHRKASSIRRYLPDH